MLIADHIDLIERAKCCDNLTSSERNFVEQLEEIYCENENANISDKQVAWLQRIIKRQ